MNPDPTIPIRNMSSELKFLGFRLYIRSCQLEARRPVPAFEHSQLKTKNLNFGPRTWNSDQGLFRSKALSIALVASSADALPADTAALSSLKTSPVSDPSNWSMASSIQLDLATSSAIGLKKGLWIASAVPLTIGINNPAAASLVWFSFPSQTFMKSTVSFGASLVTSQPSTLAKISLALPLPPLTSGKKNQPIFSSGNPLPSAASERPSVRSQLPIRWNAVFPSWKVPAASGQVAAKKPFWNGCRAASSLYTWKA